MAQLKLFTELSSEKAATLVRHSAIEVREAKYSEVIVVRSFTNDGQEYLIFLNQASAISSFSCSYTSDSKPLCKHMFLAQKVLVYSISYETRFRKISGLSETSLPDPTAKPSTEKEARLESDDFAKALFLEQIGFVKSSANGSSRVNDEEKEALNNINTQMARF